MIDMEWLEENALKTIQMSADNCDLISIHKFDENALSVVLINLSMLLSILVGQNLVLIRHLTEQEEGE